MAKLEVTFSDSKGVTSRRARLGTINPKLPETVQVPEALSWDALVAAYLGADAALTLRRRRFDEAEIRFFSSQGRAKINAEADLQVIDADYCRALDRLDQAALALLKAPATTIEAVAYKIEIALNQGESDKLLKLVLADLRRLETRHVSA